MGLDMLASEFLPTHYKQLDQIGNMWQRHVCRHGHTCQVSFDLLTIMDAVVRGRTYHHPDYHTRDEYEGVILDTYW
jgi:hypothetical protein